MLWDGNYGKSLEDGAHFNHRFYIHLDIEYIGMVLFPLHKEPQVIRNLRDQEKIDYILIGICIGIGLGFILSMWYLYPPF